MPQSFYIQIQSHPEGCANTVTLFLNPVLESLQCQCPGGRLPPGDQLMRPKRQLSVILICFLHHVHMIDLT